MVRILYIIIILHISFIVINSQEKRDTVFYTPIKEVDGIERRRDIEAIVEYSAKDSAIFDIERKTLTLYNEGVLKYKEYELRSARIILYNETSIMEAYGIPDTVFRGKYIGTPILYEGSKKYEGFKVIYNLKTRRGNITMGSTEIEGGYYLGERIEKVDDDVYFVKRGRYTTCDKPEPDYYFGSPEMKIIQKDKVIAQPVFLYVADVPVFFIPFGIFPNHSGRSSGLITPAYGEDATYGLYFSRLGYFWAINDYMDLTLRGNYFTRGRIDLTTIFRYALRYKFSGILEFSGSRIRRGEEMDVDKFFTDEWRIGFVHNQSIDPTTSITANVNMLSSKRYYDNTTNKLSDLLLQNAISNITISKSWEGTPNIITINYSRDQNLQTGEVFQRLPSISFRRTQSFPFRSKSTSLIDLKWYEVISYSYLADIVGLHSKKLQKDKRGWEFFTRDYRAGIKQEVVISAPIKFNLINVSPFFNFNELWHNRYVEKSFNLQDSSVMTSDKQGVKTFRYFNMGINITTRVIGIFPIKIFGIKGLRHTIFPSLTYSYQPDFRKPQWNIYKSYKDASGKEILYNQFEREVFGVAPAGEQQNINFGIGNVFEMKTRATDTTDNKFQLLRLDGGISYNFVADSLRLSELNMSYRTEIASLLNIGGGVSFNFYEYKQGVGRINKFLFTSKGKLADLTGFNINLSTSFKGGETKSKDTLRSEREDEYKGIYGEDTYDHTIPWQISLNYNYSITKSNPMVTTKSSNISSNLSFSLTQNWKFSVTGGYDIFRKEITAPHITIYRDLHCWEMNFNWFPIGTYRGFRFELRVKAPQLHDVKVTKQTNYRGAY